MGYNAYISYLESIGLERPTRYEYADKAQNIAMETERMINRSVMMFQWHGLPDSIPQRQLELILQMQGYAIIGRIDEKLYACYGGLGGLLDEYLRPTQAIVSIPYLHFNATWDIGRDCAIIKNDTLMQGLLPLYSKYCTLLNETEITLLLATVNQRIQEILSASDNLTIESARQFLKDVFDGKQGIIADNAFLNSLTVSNAKTVQGELREIVETLHYLKSQLYNEIGLATNYNLKKERISQAEVELNTDNLYPLVDNLYASRLQGIKDCKSLFGGDWGVELNSSWDYRIFNGEPITTKGAENDTVTPAQSGLQPIEGNDADKDRAESENAVTSENKADSGQMPNDGKAASADNDGNGVNDNDGNGVNDNGFGENGKPDNSDSDRDSDLDSGNDNGNKDDIGGEKDEDDA